MNLSKLGLDYLLFDLGNVFVAWDKRPFLEAVIKDLPPHQDAISSDYNNGFWERLIYFESNLEKGLIDWNQFCQKLSEYYQWRGSKEDLLDSFQNIFVPNQDLIEWFISSQFKITKILVSNTNIYHWRWIRANLSDLIDEFDFLHLSHEINARKPHVEFYEKLTPILDWKRVLFCDDLLENLVVPRALGAQVHKFEDNGSLWYQLQKYAIKQ